MSYATQRTSVAGQGKMDTASLEPLARGAPAASRHHRSVGPPRPAGPRAQCASQRGSWPLR
eukprot:11712687-Alexandrium_andersonii.AAC.1